MEMTVIGSVVAFLLVVVLAMQVQLSALSRKSEERDEIISKKIDELLKEKEKEKEKNIKVSNIQF